MHLYDISRPLLTSPVYPGDPRPRLEPLQRMELGDECNLTALFTCLHTGTHADAPMHYLADGKGIVSLPLAPFVGRCTVWSMQGNITRQDIEQNIGKGCRRVLLRGEGKAFLTRPAALALGALGVRLIGTDADSIATPDDEALPHKELLQNGVMILENLNLKSVPDGEYFLFAPPILVGEVDGAPVRAILIDLDNCVDEKDNCI